GDARSVDNHVAIAHRDLGFVGCFDRRLFRTALHRTADVEGTHGQLGARLADRLGGDDADRFADVHHGAAGKITPVALAADAALAFASQHRADLHLLEAGALDDVDFFFGDQAAGLHQYVAVERIDDFDRGRAAEDALAKRGDDFAALDNRFHRQTELSAAIVFNDDRVLRHVDQTAGEVTRVRRLERRVGQALTGAVGRVEVLE